MRKVFLFALVAGAVACGWPTSVLAQDCDVNTQGGCDNCDVTTECPSPADETANCGCDWYDDFEWAPLGLMPREHGWQEWGWEPDDPLTPEYDPTENPDVLGSIVDEIPDHTSGTGQCIRVIGGGTTADDQVRRFYGEQIYLHPIYTEGGDATNDGVGYDIDVSNYWVMEAWMYVPVTTEGDIFFIVLDRYLDGAAAAWAVQLEFNATSLNIIDANFDTVVSAGGLVKDTWMLLELGIDLENDTCLVYYGGNFLTGFRYAATQNPGSFQDLLSIAAIDLWSSGADAHYYDDLRVYKDDPPPFVPPALQCFPISTFDVVDGDGKTKRCADYMWRFTNQNRGTEEEPGNITEFYLDIEAGRGGVTTTNECRGAATSTTAVSPPPNWSVVKCTNWANGHALFLFSADDPNVDYISPGQSVEGTLTVDPNLGEEVVTSGTGVTVPALSVRMSAAQPDGNEAFEACATGDYSFGPAAGGAWATPQSCAGYVNVPTTSAWAKVILAVLLVGGGALLVLRSRRPVAA